MFLGRFKLGDKVPIVVLGTANGVPTTLAGAPALGIYRQDGAKVFRGSMPPLDPYGAQMLFAVSHRLDAAFALGQYRVAINYTDGGGVHRLQVDHFTIVGGGSASGNVVSLWFYPRPQANYLVMRTDADTRLLARNPHE